MNVCIVSPRLYHYLDDESETVAGGAPRQQYLIAHGLQKRGFDLSAIVADHGQPTSTTFKGVRTLTGVPEKIDKIIDIPSTLYSLFRATKRSQADVFYVRGAPRLTTAVFALSTTLRKPFVFCLANDRDLNNEYLNDRYNPLVCRAYFRAINAAETVVVQTSTQQAQIEAMFDRECVRIPNGYPIPDTSELLDHSNRNEVLWVGTSDKHQKKPLRFVELAKSFPEIPFVMVSKPKTGDPTHHDEVSRRANKVPNLEFTGPIQPDDVHEYYRRAALFVNTSDYEGFPNTFLEAWRYATPVLSLHYEVDDLFSTSEISIKTGSMDQMKQQIQSLYSNVDRRQSMGTAARKYMVQNYSIETVVSKYQRLFESI